VQTDRVISPGGFDQISFVIRLRNFSAEVFDIENSDTIELSVTLRWYPGGSVRMRSAIRKQVLKPTLVLCRMVPEIAENALLHSLHR
jgi:hypothetical protein